MQICRDHKTSRFLLLHEGGIYVEESQAIQALYAYLVWYKDFPLNMHSLLSSKKQKDFPVNLICHNAAMCIEWTRVVGKEK